MLRQLSSHNGTAAAGSCAGGCQNLRVGAGGQHGLQRPGQGRSYPQHLPGKLQACQLRPQALALQCHAIEQRENCLLIHHASLLHTNNMDQRLDQEQGTIASFQQSKLGSLHRACLLFSSGQTF